MLTVWRVIGQLSTDSGTGGEEKWLYLTTSDTDVPDCRVDVPYGGITDVRGITWRRSSVWGVSRVSLLTRRAGRGKRFYRGLPMGSIEKNSQGPRRRRQVRGDAR
jgi:hypothetical protein